MLTRTTGEVVVAIVVATPLCHQLQQFIQTQKRISRAPVEIAAAKDDSTTTKKTTVASLNKNPK
jgi:hypothetical protein